MTEKVLTTEDRLWILVETLLGYTKACMNKQDCARGMVACGWLHQFFLRYDDRKAPELNEETVEEMVAIILGRE